MVYQHGSSTKSFMEDADKVFDDAIETLRWTRLHYHEPRASETLRELEANQLLARGSEESDTSVIAINEAKAVVEDEDAERGLIEEKAVSICEVFESDAAR